MWLCALSNSIISVLCHGRIVIFKKHLFTPWQVSISIWFVSLSINSEHWIKAASHLSHKLVHTTSTPWQGSFINSIYQLLNQFKALSQGSQPLYHKPCNKMKLSKKQNRKAWHCTTNIFSHRENLHCNFFPALPYTMILEFNKSVKLNITCAPFQWSTYDSHLHSCLHPISSGPC